MNLPQYMDIAFPCLFFWQIMRDRAREEGQQETNALRVYLGNVEAAAASLVTRIQELQHLLALCEMCLHFTVNFVGCL
jgi:hypothetical protein